MYLGIYAIRAGHLIILRLNLNVNGQLAKRIKEENEKKWAKRNVNWANN